MVRKRTRASRKNYSSDDNYTDSDYELDEEHTEPAPKKYSLRQRKKTVFIEDYDYEDAEEDVPSRLESDDEDFEVERELDLSPEVEIEGKENDIEPKPDEDGLIDFEDVIRADIVVNKNRIDYEHFISTNEIKPRQQTSPKPKNKRGRKPKNQEFEQNDHNVLEPETEIMESSTEIINTNDNLPLECVQTELNVNSVDKSANVEENRLQAQPDSTVSERQENNTSVTHQESVIKVNPALQLNGNNSEAPNVNNTECKEEIEEEDDDDVILIEDKKEIIVLDDD